MSCCCTNEFNFCDTGVCTTDFFRTGITAPAAGIYTLMLNFMNSVMRIRSAIDTGSEILFPTSELNENYVYSGYILAPNNAKLSFTIDDVEYDCIKFETKKRYNLGGDIDESGEGGDFNFLRALDYTILADGNVFNIPALVGKHLEAVLMYDQSHTSPVVTLNNTGDLDLSAVGGATASTVIVIFYKDFA